MQKGTQKQNIPVQINKQIHQENTAHPAVRLGILPLKPQDGHICIKCC